MNKLEYSLAERKKLGEKLFIAYYPIGYPNLADSIEIIKGFADLVDAIELGIPFSDPLADGPVIHNAATTALKNGFRVKDAFEAARQLDKFSGIPMLFMTYANIVYRYGLSDFISDAAAVGINGLILPDLPFGVESSQLIEEANEHDVPVILFLTPKTSPERRDAILASAMGFVYYVSVEGVTGERGAIDKAVLSDVRQARQMTHLPVCIGFGISTPEQVDEANNSADGVIVGSALVSAVNPGSAVAENIENIRNKIKWMRRLS